MKNWNKWWDSLTALQKYWPLGFVAFYWFAFYFFDLLNLDNLIIGSLLLILSLGGAGSRKVFNLVFPAILTFIIYQTQPVYADALRGKIHISEPYNFELNYFGIETNEGRLTLNQWLAARTHPILDFICGLSYITYFLNFILIGVFFYFWKGRGQTQNAAEFRLQASRMMWAFFWVNMLGYSTYYWYAAAPPWYVDMYGFGPAVLNAPAEAAGAARFDELIGLGIFKGFYSKSANIFGAIPSLHIVYPMVAAYFALRLKSLRLIAVINFVLVCFSAIYLNHHYILDVLWGAVYGILICLIVDRWPRKETRGPS